MSTSLSDVAKLLGKKGGQKTKAKYGIDYYKKIGAKGRKTQKAISEKKKKK